MAYAIVALIIILLFVAILYWALNRLWPLTGAFGSSPIGTIVYVLLVVLMAIMVLFYGIAPVLHSIAGGGAAFPFR